MDFNGNELRPSPEKKSGLISRLLLLWLLPFLRRGRRKDLELSDVYQNLPEDASSKLGAQFETEWKSLVTQEQSQNRKPRLWRVLTRTIGRRYALCGVCICLDELVLRTAQPILLKMFIATFSHDVGSQSQFLYALALASVTIGHSLIYQKLSEIVTHLGIKCRLGVSSLIYRKILTLRKSDTDHLNMGKLTNLLSGDVSRMEEGFLLLHSLYVSPIQFLIYIYLLWSELGVTILGGVACIFVTLPLQVLLGRLTMQFRSRIAKRTDERGRFLNEVIQGIRLIKMYTWEVPFSSLVAKLRRKEIKFIQQHLYLKGIYGSVNAVVAKLTPFCALVLYVLFGNTVSPEKVFFAISIFNTLQGVVMHRIPTSAWQMGEMIASLNRIEEFLLATNKDQKNENRESCTKGTNNVEPKIAAKNFNASWSSAQTAVCNLNFSLSGNKLVIIAGKVGSGKSSLFNAILNEMPLSRGTCEIEGCLSYASQEAWIFPGTLRQNILFGLEMNEKRYWNTLKACCLLEDLKQFPESDLTFVGERGAALSGGQKARVNLARAIYQKADIYLLDDPLSAVDPNVSKHLVSDCIQNFLRGTLRVLVTHQLQYLSLADHIIILDKMGSISFQGTYTQLQTSGIDFASLNAHLIDDDETTEKSTQLDNEIRSTKSSGTDKSMMSRFKSSFSEKSLSCCKSEEKRVGGAGLAIFWKYFGLAGSNLHVALLALTFVATTFISNCVDYWLSIWTNSVTDGSVSKAQSATHFHTLVYCGLVVAFIITTTVRTVFFYRFCMNASVKLHEKMLASVVRAPVKFFDDNTSGRIMSRFTKDMAQIDEQLPVAFFDFTCVFLWFLGVVAVNVVSNPYSIVPATAWVVILWKLRNIFLSSVRDLKGIEATAKSPMFTHISMTVQGLGTVKALRAEDRMLNQFDRIQDTHTSVFYTMFMCNRWFAMWLEVMSGVFLGAVCFGFLMLPVSPHGGNVGVALTAILSLTGALQYGVRQSAEVENMMTPVERAFEYCALKSEASLENPDDNQKLKNWPNDGSCQFQDVSLAYEDSEIEKHRILREITFSIKPQEKVGIVGRTGAGKTSLIAALFRMTEPTGVISIDGVPIHSLGLHTLRSRISIIPQDPVLFSGSLRYNLDPFGRATDKELWGALEDVDLHHAVSTLDFQVADGGSNFSTGQRQLVCLARAILRRNKILVLDEATANVDPATDKLVQETIRNKFSNCTILTIAHRLQSVLDSDRILVLDAGKVLEFGSPELLLRNKNGPFSTMLRRRNSNNNNNSLDTINHSDVAR